MAQLTMAQMQEMLNGISGAAKAEDLAMDAEWGVDENGDPLAGQSAETDTPDMYADRSKQFKVSAK